MIFASFLFGLHSLYSYFGDKLTYRKNFIGIEETFITLFWSLFGLSDYRGVELEQFPLLERPDNTFVRLSNSKRDFVVISFNDSYCQHGVKSPKTGFAFVYVKAYHEYCLGIQNLSRDQKWFLCRYQPYQS